MDQPQTNENKFTAYRYYYVVIVAFVICLSLSLLLLLLVLKCLPICRKKYFLTFTWNWAPLFLYGNFTSRFLPPSEWEASRTLCAASSFLNLMKPKPLDRCFSWSIFNWKGNIRFKICHSVKEGGERVKKYCFCGDVFYEQSQTEQRKKFILVETKKSTINRKFSGLPHNVPVLHIFRNKIWDLLQWQNMEVLTQWDRRVDLVYFDSQLVHCLHPTFSSPLKCWRRNMLRDMQRNLLYGRYKNNQKNFHKNKLSRMGPCTNFAGETFAIAPKMRFCVYELSWTPTKKQIITKV